MKTKYNKALRMFPAFACAVLLMAGCTKPELDDDFTKGDPPPIGSYTNSSEIAPGDLVAYFPFEGNGTDAKASLTNPVLKGSASFVAGKKGLAYQGATNGWIEYSNAGALGALTSFTVSMWINTGKHEGGAQGVWAVAKQDGSFWGNFFMLIEGAGASENNMLVKVHFEKNGVPNIEHWLETTGAKRIPDMYGAWRHIAFTYNEATSRFAMYANGNKVNFPDNEAKRLASAGVDLGPLSFKNATRFVIGAYQNQLGAPFNNPEPWMLPYTGKLDELRFYKKALTDQEINALFQLEKQGR